MNSVTAFARFSFTESDAEHARGQLLELSDWRTWLDQIELHGLSGFANKHISEFALPVPDEIKLSLKALLMRHKSAALARYQTLSEISEVFARDNIPFVALKGAALMPYLYKQEALRPMRDIDLLLPKSVQHKAAERLRDIGFDLPDEQPSKYMRDMHQLPNATKTINGFVCSVELHHDGVSREVPGHFYYPESPSDIQEIAWNNLEFSALEDIQMIHQVSKHLEGLHPGGVLKLINVMDVIGLACMINDKGNWGRLESKHPHVINTLRCLHFLTPLPVSLCEKLDTLPTSTAVTNAPTGVGQIMGSLRGALSPQNSLSEKLTMLFAPSDWWMHLFYNVDPKSSLWWVKRVRHPWLVSTWLIRRLYSRLLGG